MANDRACLPPVFRARRVLPTSLLGGALVLLAACTTGSVLSLEPAVDVGASTAGVPRVQPAYASSPVQTAAVVPPQATGLQTLIPSDP